MTVALLQKLVSTISAVLEDELGHLFVRVETELFGEESQLDVWLVSKAQLVSTLGHCVG